MEREHVKLKGAAARSLATLGLGLALLLPTFLPLEQAQAAAPVCDAQGVCVEGADYKPGESLTEEDRKRQFKKHRKRKPISMSLELGSGRGSVFVDGVWISEAPLQGHQILPGAHDIQVRDGQTVRLQAAIVVPRKSPGVRIKLP